MSTIRKQHLFRIVSLSLGAITFLLGSLLPPTAEAYQESLSRPIVHGYGNFPRLPVIVPSPDGSTMVVYLVEGDLATQIVAFEDSHVGINQVDVRLSPDGRYVACLRSIGDEMRPVIEVVDTHTAERVVIAQVTQKRERGAAWEELVSVAWQDANHIIYSKVYWPSTVEWEASWTADTLLPVHGEVWSSRIDGREQRLLATGRIHRVFGASLDGNTLYVTRLIPGREEWREEGFALIDLSSGHLKNLWPQEERGAARHHSFKWIAFPDETSRVLFATSTREMTVHTTPSVIWMGDPGDEKAEAIWTVNQGREIPKSQDKIYDAPRDFLWSPDFGRTFVYQSDDWGGVWHVDPDAGIAEQLNGVELLDLRLLFWTKDGVVVQQQNSVRLLGERGEVRGEIRFRESGKSEQTPLTAAQVSSVIVDHSSVPYIHQIYDTPDEFNGSWACGPTSAVMALAHYTRLSPHPITVSIPQPHTSEYGWYVPNEYTHRSACSDEHTFSQEMEGPGGTSWPGAYGACMGYNDQGEVVAFAGKIQSYAEKHDVGHYYDRNLAQISGSMVRAM